MPSRKKTNNRAGVSTSRPSGKGQGRKRPPTNTVPRSAALARLPEYARMLNDPCTANLIPGFYGSEEGYLARFHKLVSPQTSASATAGVVLWVPDFANPGYLSATTATYNVLFIQAATSSSSLGISGVNSTAEYAVDDPAYSFVSGGTCNDFRPLSACIRMSYLGQMSSTQGMVAHLDIPFSHFEERINGVSWTVDRFFELSHKVQRTSLDALEQKWTPAGAEPAFRGHGAAGDADYAVDYNAGTYTVGQAARVTAPRVIGFAWKGFAAGTAATTIQFDFYKNVEWRPVQGSGLSVNVPTRSAGQSMAHHAVALLDKVSPGWKSKAMHEVNAQAHRLAEKALAGGSAAIMKRVAGFLL